jgi:DNA-directed RNA polymerase specialized sigma24 family protein
MCVEEGTSMSVAKQVAEHLPYLRRFARATTGSQKSGDAYVVSTLEALLADPSIISGDLPARLSLYRAFVKIVNSIEWTGEKNGEVSDTSTRETDLAA